MSKPLIYILVGPPGSGKSSYASDLGRFIQAVTVSQDNQGKEGHKKVFKEALENGMDIIVDRMNFSKEQRDRYLIPAKAAGYETYIRVFQVPKEICRARINKRQGHPTITTEKAAGNALNTFFKAYERPTSDEADFINFENGVPEFRQKAIVIDLDGTLCNIDHRLQFIRRDKWEGSKPDEKPPKPDWKNFFYNIPGDSVNEWCRAIINNFVTQGYQIVYASGRPSDHYGITKDWLVENNLWYGHLFMRERNDYRPDYLAKETILDFEIETQFIPLFFVDDRQQVIDLWRKRGYVALQCSKGDF